MSQKEKLSNGKLLGGTVAAFILAALFWQTNAPGCSGLLIVFALISCVVIYKRAAERIRSIDWGGPRRTHYTPARTDTQPMPKVTPPTDDDSRSIFL